MALPNPLPAMVASAIEWIRQHPKDTNYRAHVIQQVKGMKLSSADEAELIDLVLDASNGR